MFRITFFSFILLLLPLFAAAETVVRVGEGIRLDETQTVDGDYYVSVGPFGNTTMSGTVAGDMYALGGSVTVNGSVEQDLTVVSGRVQLHAPVADDVRLLAGEVTVAEPIAGDLFVLGGTLEVLSTASVAGNVYFFGGSAIIDAPVGGSVYGTMERLRINSAVTGTVDVTTYEPITLGSRAAIGGDVLYSSAESIIRSPEAVVEGEVRAQAVRTDTREDQLQSLLIPLFVMLFAALSLYLLFGTHFSGLYTTISQSYVRASAIGFSIIVLGPVVAILLMATVLGLLVGVATLGVTLVLVSIGIALSGAVFGMWLGSLVQPQRGASLLWITIGTVGLYGVSFIPIIGPIIVLTCTLLAIGGITIGLYTLERR